MVPLLEACHGTLGANGMAEKAVNVVRTNAITLKSYWEARIGAVIDRHRLMRHASFLFNRFQGSPTFRDSQWQAAQGEDGATR